MKVMASNFPTDPLLLICSLPDGVAVAGWLFIYLAKHLIKYQ